MIFLLVEWIKMMKNFFSGEEKTNEFFNSVEKKSEA